MIKTLIVDDEPLALDIMTSLLSAHEDVEVIGT
jgi:YesN/AraC family two-component response regulator